MLAEGCLLQHQREMHHVPQQMKVTSKGECMTQSDELIDERAMYRIRRQEMEKEKQKKKHQEKIEKRDWFSELNKGGEDGRFNRN